LEEKRAAMHSLHVARDAHWGALSVAIRDRHESKNDFLVATENYRQSRLRLQRILKNRYDFSILDGEGDSSQEDEGEYDSDSNHMCPVQSSDDDEDESSDGLIDPGSDTEDELKELIDEHTTVEGGRLNLGAPLVVNTPEQVGTSQDGRHRQGPGVHYPRLR
jgi:hypothetical protein